MSRKRVAVATASVAVFVTGIVAFPSGAQEPPPPPIAAEPLTSRAIFPDDVDLRFKIKTHVDGDGTGRRGHPRTVTRVVNVEDPSHTVVVRFTVQPGAQFPWHSHAGPVVVNIVSGALTYIDAETCTGLTYSAGEAFVDPGQGHVHSAINPTGSPTVFVATFFDAPAEGSLLIPAAPADC